MSRKLLTRLKMDPRTPPPSLSPEQRPTLDGLFLAKVDLAINEGWTPQLEEAGKPTIQVKYALRVFRTPGAGRRQVHLACELSRRDENIPGSYKGSMLVVADVDFPLPDKTPAEEMDQASAWFAVNSLVGAARAYLDMLTSLGPHPRVLLSPISAPSLVYKAMVQRVANEPASALYAAEAATAKPVTDASSSSAG